MTFIFIAYIGSHPGAFFSVLYRMSLDLFFALPAGDWGGFHGPYRPRGAGKERMRSIRKTKFFGCVAASERPFEKNIGGLESRIQSGLQQDGCRLQATRG